MLSFTSVWYVPTELPTLLFVTYATVILNATVDRNMARRLENATLIQTKCTSSCQMRQSALIVLHVSSSELPTVARNG